MGAPGRERWSSSSLWSRRISQIHICIHTYNSNCVYMCTYIHIYFTYIYIYIQWEHLVESDGVVAALGPG